MWETITSVIFFIFGITKTDNGYVDYKTQEMYNIEEIYYNSDYKYTKEDLNKFLILQYTNLKDKEYTQFYKEQE